MSTTELPPSPAFKANHAELMDGVYHWQRHIYDLTRKYYLLGRDRLIDGLEVPQGGTVLELGCGTGRNIILAARRYPNPGEAALPAYLEMQNYDTIRGNIDRVAIHHANLIEFLAGKDAGTVDRFILLDAQDWMTDDQLNALWSEISRTASAGARVIFRTAAEPSLLPGRVSTSLLDQWDYQSEASREISARDRSAIYGGFHLYVKRAA